MRCNNEKATKTYKASDKTAAKPWILPKTQETKPCKSSQAQCNGMRRTETLSAEPLRTASKARDSARPDQSFLSLSEGSGSSFTSSKASNLKSLRLSPIAELESVNNHVQASDGPCSIPLVVSNTTRGLNFKRWESSVSSTSQNI